MANHISRDRTVENRLTPTIPRRDLLRAVAIGAAVATTSGCAPGDVAEFPDKRKARYQADSPEVQTFYRVNHYPAK